MMADNDVRWLQRYDSFKKALAKLASVTVSGRKPSDLSELEKSGLVQDQDGWREMTKARNLSTHIYDKDEASEIVEDIYANFYQLLCNLNSILDKEASAYEA